MTEFRTPNRDVNRAIRSWLHEDRHEDVTRIAGAVLDQVETTPQRRSTWWPARRTPIMNKFVTIALGAAAVVVAVFVGAQMLSSPGTNLGGPGDEPAPSATVEPTPSPAADAGLPEGPHILLTGDADDPADSIPPLTVTIPAPDWYGEVGGGILAKNDTAMIVFVQREYIVYGDACQWRTTIPDTPVTTVDDFVAALSSQASREASEPVDITLGRYTGKSITLQVPEDVESTGCDPGYGGSWDCGGDGTSPCGYHSGGPDEIDTVYIVDVDGLIMAWRTGYFTGTPADVVAELEAIVQSAAFGE